VHSFCTRGKSFSVAGRNILFESGFSENVEISSLPDDDCGDAGGSWQFLRVNCRGELETRASANRLPGHCGLLYSLLLERAGPLANAGLLRSDSQNHILGIVFRSQYW
jgi:hypothetical protein